MTPTQQKLIDKGYVEVVPGVWEKRGSNALGWSRYLPYPLRAAKLSFDLNIFGFWLVPDWCYYDGLPEASRAAGETIWWARWLWFQVSYSRWM